MVQGSEHEGNYMNWTPSAMVSALQMPSHLKLKRRDDVLPQDDLQPLDYKEKLNLKEAESFVEKERFNMLSSKQKTLMLHHSKNSSALAKLNQWIDSHQAIEYTGAQRTEDGGPAAHQGDDDDDSLLSSDDDDDDEDDEEQHLMRELQKLREENLREHDSHNDLQQADQAQNVLHANPLLHSAPSQQNSDTISTFSDASANASLKRKWNNSTVFKNQAKNDKRKRARFVNDTLRSDFHKSFMHSIMK